MAASTTKTEPSNAELKRLAERVHKLKVEGKRWPEIMRTVKRPDIIKGPASGRRLLRQFNLADSIVQQKRGEKASAKKS
jgi:hypothetical protein